MRELPFRQLARLRPPVSAGCSSASAGMPLSSGDGAADAAADCPGTAWLCTGGEAPVAAGVESHPASGSARSVAEAAKRITFFCMRCTLPGRSTADTRPGRKVARMGGQPAL
ncbi:hypothetical protein [Actinoplanes utahensis]|uniref:Uncharacterized protein n=1 Tax=Actinoplanes utahensis TaxID=1869 RepID=A0A0A6UMW3_ACTUT|nr:hypothetical protein [Actinoplanes utahensis]KHD77465.1 hypothetical protein MB27_10035 [Actinoplanes utahensis]